MAFCQFQKEQFINANLKDVWYSICSPQNFKNKLLQKNMGFHSHSSNLSEKIYLGMIINYTVRYLLGVPTNWVSEIAHIKQKQYFVDEQRGIPYNISRHQHFLGSTLDGALMKDVVRYKPANGVLVDIANRFIIKKKLKEIFAYKTKALNELFEPSNPVK